MKRTMSEMATPDVGSDATPGTVSSNTAPLISTSSSQLEAAGNGGDKKARLDEENVPSAPESNLITDAQPEIQWAWIQKVIIHGLGGNIVTASLKNLKDAKWLLTKPMTKDLSFPPMFLAAFYGNYRAIGVFLKILRKQLSSQPGVPAAIWKAQYKAALNYTNEEETLLGVAVQNESGGQPGKDNAEKCIDLLVKAGCDVNKANDSGYAPLHHACCSGRGLLALLKCTGLDVNAKTNANCGSMSAMDMLETQDGGESFREILVMLGAH